VLAGIRGRRVRSLEPDAPLFTHGAVPWTSKTVNTRWRRALAKAGVRYRVPEQLRHTFASTLLSRNAPVLYVQRCGGWRSAAVLLRVYARWMPQDGDVESPRPMTARDQPVIVPVFKLAPAKAPDIAGEPERAPEARQPLTVDGQVYE